MPPDIYLTLFDKSVLPILMYGCELWGYQYVNKIEGVLITLCKRILGVSMSTANVASLCECGRKPLMTVYFKCVIKYWLQLIKCDESRILRQCYNMLYKVDIAGRTTWATHVKYLLFRYGFGFVWEAQGVGNDKVFLEEFQIRINDCSLQDQQAEIHCKSKLKLFSLINQHTVMQNYLLSLKHRKFISCIAKLRTSCHSLAIETGRYYNIESEDRFCIFCLLNNDETIIEDEYHFVMYCPQFIKLREQYISKYLPETNVYYFHKILKSRNKLCIQDLALYTYYAFKERSSLLL